MSLIDNKEKTLEQALKNALPQADSVDILTAYFYFSGFSRLAEELKDKKIRILVGNSIDPKAVGDLTNALKKNPNVPLGPFSSRNFNLTRTKRREEYIESFIDLYNKSALSESFDSTESQTMQQIFERKLRDGSLEIRMTEIQDHGKTYILHNKPEFSQGGDARGVVFMGSSNFTYSGLLGQGELNHRFSDNQDFLKYQQHFEGLWESSDSIGIQVADGNDDFLREIEKRLWIHATPDPYKIYIRILHELYAEDESEEIETPSTISGGKFLNFKYQLDAIGGGIDCLKKNNGVIIADVVGLGKSIIASTIAKNMDMRAIIITPPHLKQQWEDYGRDFKIPGVVIESGGKIDKLHARYADSTEPTLFIIDEAHRYRNELTDDYQYLHQLTRSNPDNKVVLLTATPYNNRPQDLFAMIKLFQTPSRSTINTVDNLSVRFNELISQYRKLEREGKKKLTEDIVEQLKKLSIELRRIIEPVVIRRSRIDLNEIAEYREDLERQGISFPEIIGPELMEYDLGDLAKDYVDTLQKITDEDEGLTGARYQPAKYIRDGRREEFRKKYARFFDESDLKTAQSNLAKFMKRLLVQRFESSKYAFRTTLQKIIHSNELVASWWSKGYVPILKKGDLIDPEEYSDTEFEDLMNKLDSGEEVDIEAIKKVAVPIPRDFFDETFIVDVEEDIRLLNEIYNAWFPNDEIGYDPKSEHIKAKVNELLIENPDRKVVIFSVYADTADWVYRQFKKDNERVLMYYGGSGNADKETVAANFDASYPEQRQKNDYDVIVATDALSEGFNLHRAGVVINYDIPYNPTCVVQRIGRINRINKKVFEKIFIYNCFPTAIGDEVVRVKNISTLKMLLINNIVGSDTRTLTPEEELQSYFKRRYEEADEASDERSWDNEYRNDYAAIRHDNSLLKDILDIPERTRVVRNNQHEEIAVSFARRGNGLLFAVANSYEDEATIAGAEQVLHLFKAKPEERSEKGDTDLDKKFEVLRNRITAPHPMPKIQGRRHEAADTVRLFSQSYIKEKDYLNDLYDAITLYDDLSDGELKFIVQLRNEYNFKDELEDAVNALLAKFSSQYLDTIKEKADRVDQASEIIMFTEDLRK